MAIVAVTALTLLQVGALINAVLLRLPWFSFGP